MKIETKKVYITDDGKEFGTLEECQNYESKISLEALTYKIAELKRQRELAISLKNRYKANKYGKFPTTERELQMEYDYITKMSKIPIKKMSDKNIQYLLKSFRNVEILSLQKKQQKMFLNVLRAEINDKSKKIKKLYEKVEKMKEVLNHDT